MCGRFTQHYCWTEIHGFLNLSGPARNLQPRYNISPTTIIDVCRITEAGRELIPMRWGLIPSWWKKTVQEVPATFNARSETIADKPMFRSSFRTRRCIIPASGFYEWTGERGNKTPHYFSSTRQRPLAFAGLWDEWRDDKTNENCLSATIVVGPANPWMLPFHERMPVMLEQCYFDEWLIGKNPSAAILLSRTHDLQQWVVSKRINRAGTGDHDPSLIDMVEDHSPQN